MQLSSSVYVSGSDRDMLSAGKPMRILLSSVSSDSHTWNLVFLQLFLEFKGHEVRNLGGCTPDSEIIATCEEMAPDLLVISSVNGHGNIDGERLIGKLRQNDLLSDLPVAIGGKLGIHGAENAQHIDRLLNVGFTAVFEASSSIGLFEDFVKGVSAQLRRPETVEAMS